MVRQSSSTVSPPSITTTNGSMRGSRLTVEKKMEEMKPSKRSVDTPRLCRQARPVWPAVSHDAFHSKWESLLKLLRRTMLFCPSDSYDCLVNPILSIIPRETGYDGADSTQQ